MRRAVAAAQRTLVRPQTLGEEIANAVSHGLGFLLAVASLPILVWTAGHRGAAVDVHSFPFTTLFRSRKSVV